jgi:hypothetical protein
MRGGNQGNPVVRAQAVLGTSHREMPIRGQGNAAGAVITRVRCARCAAARVGLRGQVRRDGQGSAMAAEPNLGVFSSALAPMSPLATPHNRVNVLTLTNGDSNPVDHFDPL